MPQAATGLRFACRARSVGGHFMQTNLRSWIAPFHGNLLMPQEALLRRERTFANILLVLASLQEMEHQTCDTAERKYIKYVKGI